MELVDKQLKYPNSAWLLLFIQFCEKNAYFGVKTVLVLYLTTILRFNGNQSMIIFHSFYGLAYAVSLIGAVLTDSTWGKINIIICFSIVYTLGGFILTGASMAEILSTDIQKVITVIGLFLISIGDGIKKPLNVTFAGDQFKFPQQQKQFQIFIKRYVIVIQLCVLLSSVLGPELRYNIHCFGKETCYPLVFGVSATLMLIALATIVLSQNMFVRKNPEHKAVLRTFGCIFYALRKRITSGTSRDNIHWLNLAKSKYTYEEIMDTRAALNVITVFMTYPMIWALFEQGISRWTLQATLMDGHLNFMNWTIKPDQMQSVTPLFSLILLFLLNDIINPLLSKIYIRKPLEKVTLCCCLAAMAFMFATLLQLCIIGKGNVIPDTEGRINIYNGFNCNVHARSPSLNVDLNIRPFEMIDVNSKPVSQEEIVEIILHIDQACTSVPKNFELNTTLSVTKGKEVSYYLTHLNTNSIALKRIGNYDNYVQNKQGNPSLRILMDDSFGLNNNISLISSKGNSYSLSSSQLIDFNEVHMEKYDLILNEKPMFQKYMKMIPATFYTITLQKNGQETDVKMFSKYKGNYIHIFWQLPQYIFMVLAGTIFLVTTIEFSFVEAPQRLKTFVYAFDMLTIAGGNLLVAIISAVSIKNQVFEYLLYCGLIIADMLIIAYFSVTYRSINNTSARATNEYATSAQNEEEVNTFL